MLGYVLFDVVLALFLFSLGFAVLFGLTEGALTQARQATALMEGANLAQETMDQLAVNSWSENFISGACIPGGLVEGREGKYHWVIESNWEDIPQLLRVSVLVRWRDQDTPFEYELECLYEVE